jgi:hypothetical protein
MTQGSWKHLVECHIIYGSVVSQWNNEKQRLEYFIPATCLNAFNKDETYFITNEDTMKAYGLLSKDG